MYLGIDLGTSAVKLLVADREGNILESISKKYPVNYLNGNWAEQDPMDWWNACCEGIREIKNRSSIRGVSFSGQMHGLVLLDSQDRVIRPAIIWCDQRTTSECETLNNAPFDIKEIIGNEVLTGFTSPKLLWIKNNELHNYKRIAKIMLPKDFIAYNLSKVHATDYSDASGTALLDVKNKKWSGDILDLLELSPGQLPDLYESYERIGSIDSGVATQLGLPQDTGIIIGGGDQAVGAVGVGAVEEGILSLALGTSGVVFACNNTFERDSEFRLHSFCHANGKFHQMGVILSASASLKWWVETINEDNDYEKYTSEASLTPAGAENLFFLPYLMGERTPHNDSFAKGTFIGLNPTHTKAHMTRSVIEGVSFALNDTLSLLKDMDLPIKSIRVSGGGAKSDLWKQILADIFGYDVITINSTEGPALGAAILAMVGSGEYTSVEEACSHIIRETERTIPGPDKDIYEGLYHKFTRLYPLIKDAYRVI